MSVYTTLSAVDVGEKIEKKGRLSYLSWAWAWGELKKRYPDAKSKVYEREDGRPYWDDGRTCWVKCSVTVEGEEIIEYLPIMNARNLSIPLKEVTSMEVNKSIQRCVTKAIARHGLGLYIYAGEDLPEKDAEAKAAQKATLAQAMRENREPVIPTDGKGNPVCELCGAPVAGYGKNPPAAMWKYTKSKYGKGLCAECAKKVAAAQEKKVALTAELAAEE